MAVKTTIGWCDSTLNLQMGCNGCELWNRKSGVFHCYAGTLTDRYAGQKGWPDSFEEPKLFTERLDKALRWSDLTGKERPDKPWLNGLPRMIFLNDMGDTFTEGLPIDWLAPLLPRLTESPHIYMLLTKRAKRMREFAENHPLPDNIWPGVSVTSEATVKRLIYLMSIQSGGAKWISAEPLLGAIDLAEAFRCPKCLCRPGKPLQCRPGDCNRLIDLVITGGESGHKARPCHINWIREIGRQCQAAGVAWFNKQLGANCLVRESTKEEYLKGTHAEMEWPDGTTFARTRAILRDSHGADMTEWPGDLRARNIPQLIRST